MASLPELCATRSGNDAQRSPPDPCSGESIPAQPPEPRERLAAIIARQFGRTANRSTTPLLLGVDIGTSDTKVLATTIDGAEIAVPHRDPRWSTRAGSWTRPTPTSCFTGGAALGRASRTATRSSASAVPGARASPPPGSAKRVSCLIDEPPGTTSSPGLDPRRRTGVPPARPTPLSDNPRAHRPAVSSLASVAKLASIARRGIELAHSTLALGPGYIAFRSRTPARGTLMARPHRLVDQDTSAVSAGDGAGAGADAESYRPSSAPGTPLGARRTPRPATGSPSALAGAVVDPLPDMIIRRPPRIGASDRSHHSTPSAPPSCSCAPTPRTLDYGARSELALAGIDTVHHVLGDQRILVAGTKTGLLLRRTLDLLGMRDGSARDNLDAAALALAVDMAGITVAGANNDDGNLRIAVDTDTATPAGLWLAVLDHGNREVNSLLAIMAAEVGPFSRTVVAGGWTRMASVRRAKQDALPEVRVESRAGRRVRCRTVRRACRRGCRTARPARGDATANAIDHPTGPSDQFAAQFTDPRPATAAGRIPEESTA